MIIARVVFQAKFGKADEVVASIKESITSASDEQLASIQPRILTDLSGPFDTVVVETTHENMAALEQFRQMLFARAEGSGEQSRMNDLVESGRNEYYRIEM